MKFFKPTDFDCSCGCGSVPKTETMQKADMIRQLFGSPLVATSGARCQKKQDSLIKQGLSKAKHSKHISGEAIDLAPWIARGEMTQDEIERAFFEAMGRLHRFLIDSAEELDIWVEDPAATSSWAHIQIVPYPSWVEGKSRVFHP